jgi:hypothetical protein
MQTGDLTQVRREAKPSPAEVVAPASTVVTGNACPRRDETFRARRGSPSPPPCSQSPV